MPVTVLHVSESAGDSDETEAGACKPTSTTTLLNAATGGTNKHTWAARWASVAIPKGATILKVNLQLFVPSGTAEASRQMHGNMLFALEDSAAALTEVAKNLARSSSSTAVQWDGVLPANAYSESPDNTVASPKASLHAALQEVINRAGWQEGNALCMLMTASELCKVSIEAWDKEKSEVHAPILTVEWMLGTTPPEPRPPWFRQMARYRVPAPTTNPAGGAFTQVFEAHLNFQGTLPRAAARQTSATVTFQGTLPRSASKALTAGLTTAGALPRAIARSLTSGLSFRGTLPRAAARQTSASLNFQGVLPQATARQTLATVNFQGALPRSTSKTLAAALTTAGVLPRAIARGLTGGLSFQGTVSRSVGRVMAASLSFLGELTRTESGKFVKKFTAALTFQGSASRNAGHGIAASLSPSATSSRNVGKPLAASVTPAGTLPRGAARALRASVSFAGAMGRTISVPLAANVNFQGTLPRAITKRLSGAVTFKGVPVRAIARNLRGKLSFLGKLLENEGRSPEVGKAVLAAEPSNTATFTIVTVTGAAITAESPRLAIPTATASVTATITATATVTASLSTAPG